ncbi:relaxase/mobilization nuclease domain-containing protein [Pseudoalteromonas sp. SMS1]|uniref:relaxase/mobilization nuclease domain-containing protein n=1 Tax=Pseudoalteromonas sp. SMS1 TaxID=2908894 RepID=UPI001F4806DA|nr:relaxase/mobilization nuclease domain-containing protein [Pseudoalteromonas sp. SMS1]MCF2857930.1 relaxase/mobilization nuclease domain-containing protein [Pseudoalteromonas sp. SMS1]
MAIAKLLHEGETVKQLKSIIRYNTVAKEYLNSPENPRLLQALSNLGVIDISDLVAYQGFMDGFIEEVKLNKSQSTNRRQTKLYAHEMLSFEDEDNARFTQDELAQISVELLSSLYDMENTPYLIYPQVDSGRLHFHFVRGMHNSLGEYQRVKNSKRKMRVACEKIERKYNLTPTGNNVSNEIRPANDPMAKVMKNRKLEAEYQHQKNLSAAKEQDAPLTKLKRKSYDLLMEGKYQNEAEMAEHTSYEQVQQNLTETTQVNQKLETVKKHIFNLYKSANDEADFIEQLEEQEITVEIIKHAKSGKNKGIVFHHKGETISGGKISSSMTLGKIKKRFPNFIHTLEKPPSLRATFKQQRKMLDFQIENINRYYKQQRNNVNGDILIYFGKKNIVARPYNYNIVLSNDRSKIRFGSSTNSYDLTLSINVALENGWQAATLTNSSPDFLKRMMKAAYEKDPDLLFFVQPDKSQQLTLRDLIEIKSNLCFQDITIAIKNDLLVKNENKKVISKLRELAESEGERAFIAAFERGFSITELCKKTERELLKFMQNDSFQKPHTTQPKEQKRAVEVQLEERDNQLQELRHQAPTGSVETPLNTIKHWNKIRPQ